MNRTRTWILAAIAVLAALAWTIQRSPWLSARLRAPVEAALAKATGRPVSVGGVGGGLSGWLWLHDVSVGPAPGGLPLDVSFTAGALGLKLDAWGLLKGRADLSSLQAVQVEDPRVYILRSGVPSEGRPPAAEPASPTGAASPGNAASSGKAASSGNAASPGAAGRAPATASVDLGAEEWRSNLQRLPVPAVRITIHHGAAWDQAGGRAPSLLADGVSLLVEPSEDGGWRLTASGRPAGQGSANVTGRCGPSFSGLEAELRFTEVTWPSWLETPAGLPAPQGHVSGELEARAVRGAWPAGIELKGHGTLAEVGIQADAGRPGVSDLRFRWEVQGPHVALDGLEASYAGGRIAGGLSADLRQQLFSATVTARGMDLGRMALSAGAPPDLGLQGAADLEFDAAGPLTAPAMTLTLRSQTASWQGHPLAGIDLQASGGKGRWEADGSLAWDGGRGSLSLTLGPAGLETGSLQVTSLPADWLKAWAGPDINGRVDGEGSYNGDQSAWELELRGAHLEVRGSSVDRAALQSSGDAHTANLRLEADLPGRPELNGEASAVRGQNGTWSLRSARVYQKDRQLLQASGQWTPAREGSPAALSLTVKTGQIDLGLLAGTPAPGGWTGAVQADGAVTLLGGAWRGELHAQGPSLARRGFALPGAASVYFGPEGVTLTGVSLRHGEARGSATAPKWSGPWDADLTLDKAWVPALAALADGAPADLSGRASGDLSYRSAAEPRFAARLDCEDPLPRLLPGAAGSVDLVAEGKRWSLRSLQLSQSGGGSLSASAELDFGGKGPWSGQARWEQMVVQGVTTTGSARLSGGAGQPGRVAVESWSLSATALPDMEADFFFGASGFDALEGKIGDAVRWTARRSEGIWTGRADLSNEDPGPLVGAWLGRAAPSGLRLDGFVEAGFASLTRPAYVNAQLREAGSPGSSLRAKWSWAAAGPQGSAEFRGVELGRLSQAAGALGLPAPSVGGKASGSVALDTRGATVVAFVDALSWGGTALGPLSVTAGWGGGGAWIRDASVGGPGPSLRLANASWQQGPKGWTAEGSVLANLLPLAVCDVSADAEIKLASAKGKTGVEARFRTLTVGQRVWSDYGLSGTWDGYRYTLQERSKRPDFSAAGWVSGSAFAVDDMRAFSGKGRGWLKGRMGADGSLDFDGATLGMRASDLAGMMGWKQDWTGTAFGTLKVSGAVGKVHTVVSAKVEDGSVDGLPFDLGTAYVVQDGDWVDLSPQEPIRISRADGTALEVGGKVTLIDDPAPGQGMDVWAELKNGGLRLFSGMPAIKAADGPLELKLRFTGKPANPRVDGSFRVSGGTLEPSWLLPKLEQAEILMQVKDSKVTLQKAEARVKADGRLLKVEALDPHRPAFVFDAWVPASMNLRIRSTASGLPVAFTSALRFVKGVMHPDLTLTGTWDRPALGGSVTLDRGCVVEWPAVFVPAPKPGETGWFDRVEYSVVVKARTDVMVRTDAAQVFVDTGDQGVRVLGSGDNKTGTGRLRLQHGSVDYLLATFRLADDRDTYIDLRGDAPPLLELWGVNDLGNVQIGGQGAPRDVQVRLHAWGPLDKVQMRLEGDDPSLTQDQLATLLGMGSNADDPRNQGGFSRMLGKVPAGVLTSIGRKYGLWDEVGMSVPAMDQAIAAPTPGAGDSGQVAPQGQATPVTATGKSLFDVTVGKYFGPKVYVGVDAQAVEPAAGGVDPELGFKGEYQLGNGSRVSLQRNVDAATGQPEWRGVVQGNVSFDNYNPRRRRWDAPDTATPTPTPSVQGTPPAAAPSTAPPSLVPSPPTAVPGPSADPARATPTPAP